LEKIREKLEMMKRKLIKKRKTLETIEEKEEIEQENLGLRK